MDQGDGITQLLGLLHDVRREDDRAPGPLEVEDQLAHDLDVHRVEPGERLVEDDQVGIVDHGPQDLHLLAHALRQRFASLAGPLGQAVVLQQVGGLALGVTRRQTLESAEVGQDVDRLHLLVETLFLGQVAEAVFDGFGVGLAQNADRSGVRIEMLITMRMVVVLPAPFGPRKP